MEAADIEVTPGTREEIEARHVLGLIKFKDLIGVRNEVFYGAPAASTMFHPSRAISGFKTENMGIGHAVLWYPDVDGGIRFYRDLLGLIVSDNRAGAAFFHCNPRHHSLAMFEPRPGVTGHINHFMVQYNSLDDVGQTFDICEQRGERFATLLGRHPNDQNISFYVHNPSGWNTEFAWGARDIDDSVWETEYFRSIPGAESFWDHNRARHAEFERNMG